MNYRSGNSFAQGAATGLRIIGGMVDLLERREDRERTHKREDAKFNAWEEDRTYLKGTTRPQQEARARTEQKARELGLESGRAKFNEWEADKELRAKKRTNEGIKQDVYGNIIRNPLYESAQLEELQRKVNTGKKSTLDLERAQKTQTGNIAGINASNRGKVLDKDLKEKTQGDRIRAIEAGADVTESQANVAFGTEDAKIIAAEAAARAGVAKADTLEDEGSKTRYKLKDGGKVTKAKLIKEFKAATKSGKDDMGMPVYVDIVTGELTTFIKWVNERLETPLPVKKDSKKKVRTLPKDRTKALESFVIN